jgi:hypothetical protein
MKINPFSENLHFFLDIMITMGFIRDEINDALINQKYDEVMATYILLGRKPPEVSFLPFLINVNYFLSSMTAKYKIC